MDTKILFDKELYLLNFDRISCNPVLENELKKHYEEFEKEFNKINPYTLYALMHWNYNLKNNLTKFYLNIQRRNPLKKLANLQKCVDILLLLFIMPKKILS